MHLSLKRQRIFDNTKVKEIMPYFDFQNKIAVVLERIKQTNELRVKVQDHKFKKCKQQVKDNKVQMKQNLKVKVNELLDQEMENKS